MIYREFSQDKRVAVVSTLYDGPNKELYVNNEEFFVGSHIEYCKKNRYDYYCFDDDLITSDDINGALTQDEIDYTMNNAMFGVYKWILAYYMIDIKNYERAVIVDYDTRFMRKVKMPDELYRSDLGLSNIHAWSQVNAPSVFFWSKWLDIPIKKDTYSYWYNTGLFTVGRNFEFMTLLKNYINETRKILESEKPFAMNLYTPYEHDCLFKANDEIFLQLLIAKKDPIVFHFDSNWNSGTDSKKTILRHYTDKGNIPRHG